MKRSIVSLFIILLVLSVESSAPAQTSSRYQSLLATSAGRDSLLNLALWEDGRVTGNDRLFAYLTSSNWLIRLRAVEVVGRIQDPQDVPYLLPLLEDPNPLVVDETIFALGQIASADAVPALLDVNKSASPARQIIIAEALGKIGGDDAVATLVEMLRAFQSPVRGAACLGLARAADPESLNALLVAINDGDPKVACKAIYALEKIDSDPGRVRHAVRPFLERPDANVRASAARTLGKQKADDKLTIQGLIVCLSDPDLRVTINATNALGMILENRKNDDVVPPLGAIVTRHPSHHARKAAVMALGHNGHKNAGDFLVQSGLEREPGVRAESYKALAKTLGKNSVVFLTTGLNDSERIVRAATIESFGISGEDKQIGFLVERARKEKDPLMRAAAVRALGYFDKDEAVEALIERLQAEVAAK